MSLDLGLIFFGCIAFCILCFGLVPMALQHGFVYIVRRWTGRGSPLFSRTLTRRPI
jgi:hypothetical protein